MVTMKNYLIKHTQNLPNDCPNEKGSVKICVDINELYYERSGSRTVSIITQINSQVLTNVCVQQMKY